MSHTDSTPKHDHHCESCRLICEESKKRVKKLEKQVYAMTIALSVSVTLLGQEGVKLLSSYIGTIKSVSTDSPDASGTKKAEDKPNEIKDHAKLPPVGGKVAMGYWKPTFTKRDGEGEVSQRPYRITDELTMAPKEKEKEPEVIDVLPPSAQAKAIAEAATQANTDLFIPSLPAAEAEDWRTVLLTPSTLPFDVYSTTIALGNNYGFGEYYGLGDANGYVTPAIPSPSGLSVFGIAPLFNNRKRN